MIRAKENKRSEEGMILPLIRKSSISAERSEQRMIFPDHIEKSVEILIIGYLSRVDCYKDVISFLMTLAVMLFKS